jgi:hypothetical protein
MVTDRVDVFVSYAREDRAFAAMIGRGLEQQGLSVWSDREILAGHDFTHEISRALQQASVVVVILSGTAGRSTWLKAEVSEALSQRKNVIPVLLGPESKSNFVWPLVSDRQAIYVDSIDDSTDVVSRLTRIIQRDDGPSASRYPGESPVPPAMRSARPLAAGRSVWLIVIIAALAAFLGALLTLAIVR